MSDEKKVFGRAEEFMTLFNQGAEFTKELLQENERLRHDLLSLQEDHRQAATDPGDWAKLRVDLLSQIDVLTTEKNNALERLKMVEAENRQFAERYVEIEEENNNLANLYVSSYQLHSTLALPEVLKIIIEIVINLVGAEVFAVYILDENTGELGVAASEGVPMSEFPRCKIGAGPIGRR